ncbi:WD40 repeat domain-containing serine/threonine protein kinase [Nocardiopsis sp. NPDC006938]|uniref:WD40 repeat domain-containing serine/threonine protein kinase n=1 Tax=Nocardiopsis sp. NPDC006938 TaxID=3364337 RepID=UPI0036C44D3F
MRPLSPDDPRLIGPHRVLARVGSGGMGQVYLARTPEGRLAALKVVREELAGDPEFRARFAREVRTAQRVRGPFTPAVLSADPDAAAPWMATEYVPGPTLREAVRRDGPLPEGSLRVLTLGLATAVRAVHDAGLMHRDLKPGNVLLSPRGPQVIDFGIARAVEGTVLTRAGQTFGTPSYTSPEQVTGGEATPASDVFSLAGVVVFAATGRPPFGTGRPADVLRRVVGGDPVLDGVPDDLRPLLARCLAKDPAGRPRAEAVARELASVPATTAEHGWLPAPVHRSVAAHEEEADQVVRDSVAHSEHPSAAPRRRRRAPLFAGAVAAALVLAAGAGLAAASPWSTGGEAGHDDGNERRSAPVPGNPDASETADDPAEEWDGETGFGSFVNAMAFTPDGSGVYVHTTDAMTLWDWESGRFRHRFDPKPSSFDVADDGTVVGTYADTTTVFGPDHGVLALFDPGGGAPEPEEYGAVSVSPDGSLVAMVASHPDAPRLYVWDWEEDEVVFTTAQEGPVSGTHFTPDGRYLLVRHQYDQPLVTMYEVASLGGDPRVLGGLGELGADWGPHAFSPTEPIVAVRLPDDDIALYDYESGETVRTIGTERGYRATAFSSDGRTLYSSGLRLTASGPSGGRVWDVATGEEQVTGDTLLVEILAVHPRDEVIATFAGDTLLLLAPDTLDVVNEIG